MKRETILNTVIGFGILAVALYASSSGETFTITLATKAAILALAGAGLNIALGHGGLVSLGHAAFFGIGGYAAGILATHAMYYEPVLTWPFEVEGTQSMPIIWLVAIAASGLVALVIGALSLRTTGVFFIMITLAFAQMLYYFAISWPAYGGEDGLSLGLRNSFPGLNTLDPLTFFLICYGLLMAVLGLSALLARSRFGMALNGARQNAERLKSLGINPQRVLLTAFTLSGMVTGLSGALYADLNRFVSPEMMSWHTSGEIMVFVILGGVGRLFGPLAGAALYIVLEHSLGGVSEYWQFMLGGLLLLVVLFARGGLVGLFAGERRHG